MTNDIKKLKEVAKEFKKFKEWGYNTNEAAQNALATVLASEHKYIYKNEHNEASHIFINGYVLFFRGGIYKNINH